ncbi:membrane fusion protein, multidrug efflux system [Ketogulonicigenium robustum]|uniref:Membrane fusion protein, multidrug efflux system n=1 Tax=Ketogulonicigenium robustum TaxID=92947 RepID=A0A1W6NWH6_9RHOB|nr:efflux RND transporter periplasmic adaptor subunit [Ketogulonicigenium robustum]ARO13561.1 membrane fusion protein, multidrug efflux system [Ketogulonicigenium robustum]
MTRKPESQMKPTLPLRHLLTPLAILLLSAGMAIAQPMGGGGGFGGRSAGPTQVGVVTAAVETVALTEVIPGRAVAFQESAVRPRVGGMITEILYVSGQDVTVGTPLFRIESDTYEAAVLSAEATLTQATTARDNAATNLQRLEQLSNNNAATRTDMDGARATFAAAQATLVNAQNALDDAQRELKWTTVSSPIDGIAGLPAITVGDIVTANQTTGLVNVTRIDPIYVDLTEPAARLLSVRTQIEQGQLSPKDTVDVTLTLDDGRSTSFTGALVAPEVAISQTTASQTIRFQFDNPQRRILPGMFVRGEITIGSTDAVLVPQRATSRANDGSLTVWVVGAGNKSEQRTLTSMGVTRNSWIVTEGLIAGDQIIVDGLSNMQAGRDVVPVPVTINALGLVEDVPATPQGGN